MVDSRALAENSLIEEDFLVELKANGMSDATLETYQDAVETLGNIDVPPEKMSKKDLVKWSAETLEGYANSTKNLYKINVKRYLKWLKTGDFNGGEYPPCVDWIHTNNTAKNLPKEILSREEVKQLASATDKQRDRAMIWVGYESGCRPGELVNMKVRDVEFDRYGAQIMVDGKTGERRIRIVEAVPDLRNWLSMHPQGNDPEAWMWPSKKGDSLLERSWYYNLRKIGRKAGIKKRIYPYLLRHSRATHLAGEGLNEAQLREIFGWSKDSDMPSVYVHLSARDTDGAILELYGMDKDLKVGENSFEKSIRECSFCGHENSPNAKFCEECNAPLNAVAAESTDKKVREQDQLTKKVIQRLMDKAPEVLEEVLKEEEISSEFRRLGESKAKT